MHSRFSRFIPVGLKESAKLCLCWVPQNWRYGSTYRKWCRFLKSAQYWSGDQIQQWQLGRLKAIVSHAYYQTTGYRELFRTHGVAPEDIRTLHDIRLLPLTTKELIRDNLKDFSVESVTRVHQKTSGSTGIPLGFYEPWYIGEIEDAFLFSAWSSVGWRMGELNAVLRGSFVGSEREPWRYEPYQNQLLLSSYYLTERAIDAYVDAIKRFQPRVLQAYPSSVNLLCDLLIQSGRVGHISFDLILMGSENVYDWILEKVDRVFPRARPFAWYGLAERVIMAPWCTFEKKYHVLPFYGYTEILDPDDEEVKQGQGGELVGTSFHMRSTPFIRYRTKDLAIKGPSACNTCGRSFQLLEQVEGRSHEMILTATGRCIRMSAINMNYDVFQNVRQFQFCQSRPGEVLFKVVRKEAYSENDTKRIRQELMTKFGEDTSLDLVFVNEIPITCSGKRTFLDQKLLISHGSL
jgi:phenylacetate-CoA ligase